MALILAVTITVMGLVSFAHAQEECPYRQYRAAWGHFVPRPNKIGQELQLILSRAQSLAEKPSDPIIDLAARCGNLIMLEIVKLTTTGDDTKGGERHV